jgi:TRAP-type uncharacterized transport system substrate-binding protein
MELAMTNNIEFISISEKEESFVLGSEPYLTHSTLPANVYRDQTEDIRGIGSKTILCVLGDANDDFVYKIMKVVFDDVGPDTPGRFTQFHKESGGFTLNFALSAAGIVPFHSSAINYYKDRGVWTPESEETNKRLLSEAGESK